MRGARTTLARRAALPFVILVSFLSVVNLSLTFPVLPAVLDDLTGDEARAAWVNGGLIALWSILQFLTAPVLGGLSDRFGRRPIIIASSIGFALDYVLLFLASDLLWIVIGRIISGTLAGGISAAHAYVADVTSPEARARAFGQLRAAMALGFIVGPLLGGVLGAIDLRLPFLLSAMMAALVALYAAFALPESLSPDLRRRFSWRSANAFGAVAWIAASSRLRSLGLIAFLAQFAQYALQTTFVLYAAERHGMNTVDTGLLFGVMGGCSILANVVVLPRAVSMVKEKGALVLALAAGAAGFLLLAFAHARPTVWLAMVATSFWTMAGPAAQAMLTRRVSSLEQGRLQGSMVSAVALAGIFAPPVFGLLYGGVVFGARFDGAPFVGAALILGAAIVLAARRDRVGERAGEVVGTPGGRIDARP
jgi:DHA1 family tetracycline resistance protein-like MFS transporter